MPGSAGRGGAGGWSWTWACGQKRIHLLTRWTQTSQHRGTFISSTSQLGPLVPSPPPQPPGRRPLIRLGPSRAQCAALGAGLAGKRQRCVVWKGLMLPGLPGAPQSSAQRSPAADLGQGVGREPAEGAWLPIPGAPTLAHLGCGRAPFSLPLVSPSPPPPPHPVSLLQLSLDPSVPLLPSSLLRILLGKAAPGPTPSQLVY